MLTSKTGKVFISHATDDRPLAEALSELIETGIGLSHDQIFCTSLAGQGIPAGADFKSHIHGELANSVVVIALLTPNYYASAFCLCELGGTWVLSKDFLPFVTPLAGFGDLKAVLKGVQALRIDDGTALDEMRDRLSSMGSPAVPTSRWSVKKDKFLKGLQPILAALPKPQAATIADLKQASDERDGYRAEVEVLESELKALKVKYAELGKRKEKGAKEEIDLRFSGEDEKFKKLQQEAKKLITPFGRTMKEAFYYHTQGKTWHPDDSWDDRVEALVEQGLLISSEAGVDVKEDHPKIRPVLAALGKLKQFVNDATPEFQENYEEAHTDELAFENRGFWKRHL